MDDQYEYWKDKVECIIYNTITHSLIIEFTRPSIPDVKYDDIPVRDIFAIRALLSNRAEKMVYDGHDFNEYYYGISPDDYNYILNKYLKRRKNNG